MPGLPNSATLELALSLLCNHERTTFLLDTKDPGSRSKTGLASRCNLTSELLRLGNIIFCLSISPIFKIHLPNWPQILKQKCRPREHRQDISAALTTEYSFTCADKTRMVWPWLAGSVRKHMVASWNSFSAVSALHSVLLLQKPMYTSMSTYVHLIWYPLHTSAVFVISQFSFFLPLR